MNSLQVFGLQVALSLVVCGLVAKWYVSPRLASLPLPAALQPLLVLHAFRHLGLVFLVPTVVGPAFPASFAVPAAYGTSLAGLLALTAIGALRARSSLGIPLTWLFNVVGLLDLVNAFYLGLVHNVQFGAAYYIPILVAPAAVITHVMIFHMLLRRSAAGVMLVE
jgi:hypothetical protein